MLAKLTIKNTKEIFSILSPGEWKEEYEPILRFVYLLWNEACSCSSDVQSLLTVLEARIIQCSINKKVTQQEIDFFDKIIDAFEMQEHSEEELQSMRSEGAKLGPIYYGFREKTDDGT